MIWYHRSGLHDHILRDVQFYCSSGRFLNWSCVTLYWDPQSQGLRLRLRLSAVDLTRTSWKHFSVSRRTSGTQSTNNCSSSRFSWSSVSREVMLKWKILLQWFEWYCTLELQLGFKINLWLSIINPALWYIAGILCLTWKSSLELDFRVNNRIYNRFGIRRRLKALSISCRYDHKIAFLRA